MAGEGSQANKTGGAFTCFAIKVADLKSVAHFSVLPLCCSACWEFKTMVAMTISKVDVLVLFY